MSAAHTSCSATIASKAAVVTDAADSGFRPQPRIPVVTSNGKILAIEVNADTRQIFLVLEESHHCQHLATFNHRHIDALIDGLIEAQERIEA